MASVMAAPKFEDVIVAVHGIGKQVRYSTVRSVATRLAASKTLAAKTKDIDLPVAPQPLGYFHSEVKGITSVVVLDNAARMNPRMASIGFAEVFWADIPDKIVKEGSTLEETKAWSRTVVARARALWVRANANQPGIVPPDFGLATEVLDEIIETVYVLENLLFLADKAGLFKFDLREVLEDYLGDVQIVTEFANYRTDIVWRFQQAMEDIYAEQCRIGNPDVELHVVAHSEGTVVSFLGLLQALSGYRLKQSGPPHEPRLELEKLTRIPEWIKHVHGYMTIGSPIDKHLLLWPRLWNTLKPAAADTELPEGQIKWRNYYDYGDPIGFKLDTARQWLDSKKSKAFDFCGCPKCQHDMGFARYLLPGKAHNDYWDDPDVFEHFIEEVVAPTSPKPDPAKRPTSKPLVYVVSPALPYFLSFCVLVLGVFLLSKAMVNFIYPYEDPLVRYFLFTRIGVVPTPSLDRWELFQNTLGIAALIAGTTLFARLPRLAAGRVPRIAGYVAFAAGCVLYMLLVSERSQAATGAIFAHFGLGPTIGMWVLAFIVGGLGWWLAVRAREGEDRRQRWVLKGMRPLILCGAFAVALIVGSQLYPPPPELTADEREALTKEQADIVKSAALDRDELDQLFKGKPESLNRLAEVKPFLAARPPVWPVLLAAALFLYLWWLATLIFDLAFVWQRYVRGSVAHDRLKEWDAAASGLSKGENGQAERCRKKPPSPAPA